MDQIKIGKFIQQKRKEKNITQSELSEKLGITDRAISKWENGNCMPDAAIMKDLCNILHITINDLFSGEVVDMKENEKKLEENLLAMTKLKEEKDKKLLDLEIMMSVPAVLVSLALIYIASFANMDDYVRIILIVLGVILIFSVCFIAIKIEQVAGYYECDNCNQKYIPTYIQVLWAPHVNRTRYMKCPKCNKRSWNKKVISK